MRAADVKALLKASYTSQEWAIFFEVHDRTGSHSRSADAVAVNMWPSRGCAIHGFEIKVSKTDWRKERENPGKADVIAQFCDYWNIVAPVGMIEISEVPAGWGLINVHQGKLRQAVQPAKNEFQKDLTKPFLAALLRRYDSEISRDIKEAVSAEVQRLSAALQPLTPPPPQPTTQKGSTALQRPPSDPFQAKYEALKKDRDQFFDLTGIKFSAHGSPGARFGQALAKLQYGGVGIDGYISQTEKLLAAMKEFKETTGLEYQSKDDVLNDPRMKRLLQGGQFAQTELETLRDWIINLAGHRGGNDF